MKYLIFSLVLLIGGCNSFIPKQQTIEVLIPVPTPIIAPVIPRPNLTIHQLTDETSEGEIAKAYVTSLMQIIQYAESLEAIIKSVNDTAEKIQNENSKQLAEEQ